MTAVDDYQGLYRSKLALRHLARPMRADARLWTASEIAEVEATGIDASAGQSQAARRKRQAAA
jgi:hypothetical protein